MPADGSRFELAEHGPANGDAVVTTDEANRLLSIWGRRSSQHRITIEADPTLWAPVAEVLWPLATPWPPDPGTPSLEDQENVRGT